MQGVWRAMAKVAKVAKVAKAGGQGEGASLAGRDSANAANSWFWMHSVWSEDGAFER